MVTKDEKRALEAGSTLDRLKAEGSVFDSAMFGARPKNGERRDGVAQARDPIERWGRIIGRALGWGAVLFLAWQFLRSFGA